MSPIERAEYLARIDKAKETAEFTRLVLVADAALKSQAIWDNARPATDDNPYCIRKGIKPYGLREFKDRRTLIIPVRDGAGVISTL
ncbi:hypothetical protein ACVBEF_18485 [Glaciimonas sp. GG7]